MHVPGVPCVARVSPHAVVANTLPVPTFRNGLALNLPSPFLSCSSRGPTCCDPLGAALRPICGGLQRWGSPSVRHPGCVVPFSAGSSSPPVPQAWCSSRSQPTRWTSGRPPAAGPAREGAHALRGPSSAPSSSSSGAPTPRRIMSPTLRSRRALRRASLAIDILHQVISSWQKPLPGKPAPGQLSTRIT